MAYTKTVWKDRNIQKPNTFQVQNNPDGTITLIPAPGTITEKGTPVNAVNMNKIEDGIYNLDAALTNKVDKISGKGLSTNDYTAVDKNEVAKVKDKADKSYVDNELASKAIIESGSNTNGIYIKYGDGTMICYNNKIFSNVPMTTATGALFTTGELSWTYPIKFIQMPSVSIIPRATNIKLFPQQLDIQLTDELRLSLTGPVSTTLGNIVINFTAIGRWK